MNDWNLNLAEEALVPAAQAPAQARAIFIRKTYVHLLFAVLAFVGLETLVQMTPAAQMMTQTILGAGRFGYLIFILMFVGVSWVANSWARSAVSLSRQYMGLSLYVLAEVVVFAPLLFIANVYYEGVIQDAAIFTMILFAGLTAVVFLTGKDFSFLGGILGIGMIAAVGFIVMSIIFGFNLPMLFTCLMIVLACGYILYETSNVLHVYNTKQHVAASLALFAAVALLFWYLLQLFMRRD
ncbi:MAG TPA: permease [Phycisphaerales bacterium]|nr:permease [Phycisphaerales bacterium]|tara:strand:+ start:1297 stop:2013 length:717 start_codon:yes stop_codon:yes gene_type:complete